jgi:hypothetical protein
MNIERRCERYEHIPPVRKPPNTLAELVIPAEVGSLAGQCKSATVIALGCTLSQGFMHTRHCKQMAYKLERVPCAQSRVIPIRAGGRDLFRSEQLFG